jgi:branched-chain amino acid transport system ATP-binding protein
MSTAPAKGIGLEVSALRAGYGMLPVLHGMKLSVPPSRLTVLVGANGAGKTTLLKTIAGVMPAMSGRIAMDGEILSGGTPADRVRRGMALVPEGRHLFPEMTVLENLELAAISLPGRRARRCWRKFWRPSRASAKDCARPPAP